MFSITIATSVPRQPPLAMSDGYMYLSDWKIVSETRVHPVLAALTSSPLAVRYSPSPANASGYG